MSAALMDAAPHWSEAAWPVLCILIAIGVLPISVTVATGGILIAAFFMRRAAARGDECLELIVTLRTLSEVQHAWQLQKRVAQHGHPYAYAWWVVAEAERIAQQVYVLSVDTAAGTISLQLNTDTMVIEYPSNRFTLRCQLSAYGLPTLAVAGNFCLSPGITTATGEQGWPRQCSSGGDAVSASTIRKRCGVSFDEAAGDRDRPAPGEGSSAERPPSAIPSQLVAGPSIVGRECSGSGNQLPSDE